MSNEKKRRMVFDYFRNISDLLIIQETHSTKEISHIWENEWGGKVIMNHGESNARGIAIFIKVGSKLTLTNIVMDDEGRFIIFDVEENDIQTTCAAIYAPNKRFTRIF